MLVGFCQLITERWVSDTAEAEMSDDILDLMESCLRAWRSLSSLISYKWDCVVGDELCWENLGYLVS